MSQQFTIDEHLILRIENEIRDLASECKRIPGLVLTEDDLKCQLFRRLLRLLGPDQSYQSEDGLWASPVHAEVPWFDEKNKLTLRPDITITDPSRLQVLAPPKGHPTAKYFAFSGNSVLIELKYYRSKRGISSRSAATIQKDVEKIQRLIAIAHKRGAPKNIYGVVAVLRRYPRRCAELKKLEDRVAAHEAIKLIILPPITN
jgi:hypothetical protein